MGPEYGRFYSEGKLTLDRQTWRSAEFARVAVGQAELEDALAETSNGLVICDTDAFATSIWHERYLGTRSQEVDAVATRRRYDLYILTGDEIPFVQDGTRDGESIRHAMQDTFRSRLLETGRRFIEVRGSPDVRLTMAVQAIDQLGNTV